MLNTGSAILNGVFDNLIASGWHRGTPRIGHLALNWHGEFENKAFNPGLVVEVDASPSVDRVHDEEKLLNLAREVFGKEADAWLRKPHVLLGGQMPAEIAAADGRERVQTILRTIQHGGVV